MREEYWWVVQEIRGTRRFEGPYRTRTAAERRLERIQGGEVSLFRSWSRDVGEVEQEYLDERASEGVVVR